MILSMSLFAALPLNLSAAAASDHTYSTNTIRNEYLSVRCDGERHVLYTTGGDPDNPYDDNERLLYDATSKALININGEIYLYSPSSSSMATPDGTSIYSYGFVGDMKVERYISFSYNTYTARYDTVEYKYVVTNLSSEYVTAGVKFIFDTMLGSNDRAPFRVAGNAISTETTYEGNSIPQVWQVFDSLDNPSIVASGTFYTSEADKPDRVQFLSWGNAYNEDIWTSDTSYGESIGDSGLTVIYDPDSLAPGQSRTVKTYYGISAFTPSESDPEGEIGFSAIAPRELLLCEDGTEYLGNPFTFNAWVSNTGGETLTNVRATVTLPGELSTSNQSIYIGDLYPGQNTNVAFIISAREMSYSTTSYYTVSITSDTSSFENTYSIYLPETQAKDTDISVDIPENVAIGDTFTMTVSVADLGFVDSVAVVPMFNDYAIELVDVTWHVSAEIQDFDWQKNRGICAWASPYYLNGDIATFTFRARESSTYAYVYSEVITQTEGALTDHFTKTENFEIGYCAHRDTYTYSINEYYHYVYCNSCGYSYEEYHTFDSAEDTTCNDCGYSNVQLGDMNGDRTVDTNDAVALLMHVFFPDQNPIYQNGDVDGNGVINSDDAVYLQMHVYFPSQYPIG